MQQLIWMIICIDRDGDYVNAYPFSTKELAMDLFNEIRRDCVDSDERIVDEDEGYWFRTHKGYECFLTNEFLDV